MVLTCKRASVFAPSSAYMVKGAAAEGPSVCVASMLDCKPDLDIKRPKDVAVPLAPGTSLTFIFKFSKSAWEAKAHHVHTCAHSIEFATASSRKLTSGRRSDS